MWHIFYRQDLGDNTLVAVASGELVTHGDFAKLGDLHTHTLDHARFELVTHIAREYFSTHHTTLFAIGKTQRSVLDVARLFTKNCTQKPLFRCKIRLTFGRDFAYKNITRSDFGANAHDPLFVEIFELVLANIRNIVCSNLGPQFGITDVDRKIFHMDGSQYIAVHQTLRKNNSVFIVGATPGEKRHQNILPKSKLAISRGSIVGKHLILFYLIAQMHERPLMQHGRTIGTKIIDEVVGALFGTFHYDFLRIHVGHRTRLLGNGHESLITRYTFLYSGRYHRHLRHNTGYGLALHV